MMKKILTLSIVSFLFIIGIPHVKAIYSDYTYDINTVSLVKVSGKDYLKLTGWAYVGKKDNLHNINPTYQIELRGYDKNGVLKIEGPYNDIAEHKSATAIGAKPADFTKAYFYRHTSGGVYLTYPNPPSSGASVDPRAEAIRKSDPSATNMFAINLNFTIQIPVSGFAKLAKAGVKRISMYLTSTLSGGNKTVYGQTFNTGSRIVQTMPIAIQSERLSTTLTQKLLNLPSQGSGLPKVGLSFENLITDVAVVAGSARARKSESLDTNIFYYYDESANRIVDDSTNNTNLYYYNIEDERINRNNSLANYEIEDIDKTQAISASGSNVYTYKARISVGSSSCSGGGKCVYNNPHSSTYAWIPGYWVAPIKDTVTPVVVTNECDRFAEGSRDKTCCLNPEDPICPQPCSEYPAGSRDKTCCLNPSDPVCPQLCAEYPGGSKAKFCCLHPSDPTCPSDNPCENIEDATAQYCCFYPSDPICPPDDGGTDEYSSDDPVNKPDVCSETGNTKVEFKYPEEGWSKQIIKNTACKISCQERVTATFEPVKYVSKAGMGFSYPVDINSARYCAADYDNAYWQRELETAAKAAKVAYDKMNEYLDKAKNLDTTCGTKDTIIRSLPSCPSPYTDSRSGQTCKCNSCGTCYNWNWDSEGCQYPSYSCFDWDTHTWGVCEGLKYGCFVREEPPYSCESSTYISCPSAEGYNLDYNSGTDDCRKYVCSSSRALWDSAQHDIADALTIASAQRAEYNEQMTYISKLLGDRNTCDNFPSLYPYSGSKNASVDIAIDNIDNQDSYKITIQNVVNNDTVYENNRQKTGTVYTVYNNRLSVYSNDRNLVGDNRTTASGFAGTYYDYSTSPTRPTYYDFWNKKATAYYRFEFENDWYVQKYTGDLSLTGGLAYLHGGRNAYTDYNVLSGFYDMQLSLVNLGPDIPGVSSSLWSIDPFTCRYNVNNVTFPPDDDENHDIYGNVGFMYRQISLTEPFPNRQPHQNWINKEYLIVSNGYSVYSNDPLYKIVLNPLTMQQIRDVYGTNYDSYNASNPYKSILVQEYINRGIITKRVVH